MARRPRRNRGAERAARARRAAARRAERLAYAEDKPRSRTTAIKAEPPEGLAGEDLDNWHADQRIARRVQRIKDLEDAYERGDTYVEGLL